MPDQAMNSPSPAQLLTSMLRTLEIPQEDFAPGPALKCSTVSCQPGTLGKAWNEATNGWILLSNQPHPLALPTQIDSEAWVEEAQWLDSEGSHHLVACSPGWQKTTVTCSQPTSGEFISQKVRFYRTRPGLVLTYEVGWTLQSVGNHHQWRPAAWRLVSISKD
jgi:hypothetical protein